MIAIVGGSVAAYVAYKTIRSIDFTQEVKIFSKEPYQPYGKMLLPYMLSTTVENNMFYKVPDTDIVLNTEIIKVDPKRRLIYDNKGNSYSFSKLIVATGADAKEPDFEISGVDSVFTVRYLKDIELIRERIKNATLRHVIVYGGGLVSLEMANALVLAGFKITILVSSNRILSKILNEKASEMVEKQIKDNFPVDILKDVKILYIDKKDDKTIVKLDGGKIIESDFVVVGKGVKPNIALLGGVGKINVGIQVDEKLKVTDDIYAAGDIVECKDAVLNKKIVHPIWPCAVEQAKIAAKNAVGLDQSILPDFTRNVLPVFNLNIFTGGVSNYEEYDCIIEDTTDGYRRILMKNGYLDGFIFTDMPMNSGIYTSLIRNRVKVGGLERKLLFGCLDPRKLL